MGMSFACLLSLAIIITAMINLQDTFKIDFSADPNLIAAEFK
jgi:hypothetical protein